MALPEIDIIGTGNLAVNLAPALEQSGCIINHVYGRTTKAAKNLADNLYQAIPTHSLDFSESRSSVFILAVSDAALEEVSRELILPDNAIVAHTSGSKPLSILGYTASPNIGVFYPVQTFLRHKRTSFKEVPILVEGDNAFTEKWLFKIARQLSGQALKVTTRQRQLVYLAAIFAGDFTNAMLAHANDLMAMAKLDLPILAPLLAETISRSLSVGPQNAQTGPAASGELQLLDDHMQMLARLPEKQEVYRLLSQQIIDRADEE